MPMPRLWQLTGYNVPPWAFDHESQKKAWADLQSWIPKLLARAARIQTYTEHIVFG